MQISKETELREKFENHVQHLKLPRIYLNSIFTFMLKELSLALEEKEKKTIKKMTKLYRDSGGDFDFVLFSLKQ